METTNQTSFIPHRGLTPEDRPKSSSGGGLLTVIAVMILIISGAFYGASVGYRHYLTNQIEGPCQQISADTTRCGLRQTVEKERSAIEERTLLEIKRLDTKLKLAGSIVEAHNTISPVFALLKDYTLKSIRYTQFAFASKNTINISGRASSYEDIALQSDVFNGQKNKTIESFIFSDLDLDGQGNVTFKLTMVLTPDAISYIKTFQPTL